MENISAEIALFRDTILESNSDLLAQIKQYPYYKQIIGTLNTRTPEDIYMEARQIYESLKADQITNKELEKQKFKLIILLSSIEDAKREQIREKLPNRSKRIPLLNNNSNSSSRTKNRFFLDEKNGKGAEKFER